jgi:hypothetical protein
LENKAQIYEFSLKFQTKFLGFQGVSRVGPVMKESPDFVMVHKIGAWLYM